MFIGAIIHAFTGPVFLSKKMKFKNQSQTKSPLKSCLRNLIWIISLGFLTTGCHPVLLGEDGPPRPVAEPGQEPLPGQRNGIFPRPVPEVVWDEPPPCEWPTPNQQSVCARLRYRINAEVFEIIWTEDGIQRETLSLADVPDGVTSFSPDLSQLVIQTPRGHTAGGPLYLYDLEKESLRNLNAEVGLPIYTSVSALRVVGWHRNGHQLLLVNEDDEVAIWLDLIDDSYRRLGLGIDHSQMAPPRNFMLAADGSGFTFETHKRNGIERENQSANLYWYNLETDNSHLLLDLPAWLGRLAATAIAPDGEKLAYLLLHGGRARGRSEEVHLLDLTPENKDTVTADGVNGHLLLAGNLGPTRPIWSPDGEQIALIRRNLSEPLRANPETPPPLGDIWIISTSTGEATQLTFTEALDRPPIWSPDGRYLAFVTESGQIGMVATDEPGTIWALGTPVAPNPRFIQLAFAPLEQNK